MNRVWGLQDIEKAYMATGLPPTIWDDFASKLFHFGKTRRTTGRRSQLNHFEGHLKQWAAPRGYGRAEAKWVVMLEAVYRGYPVKKIRLSNGEIVEAPVDPNTASTAEFSILIDTLHQLAAADDIVLVEA